MRRSPGPPLAPGTPHPDTMDPGVRLDARDPTFRDDPHPILDRLRESDPVHRDRAFDRVVLTRAADVADALTDRTLSSDPFKARSTAYARRGFTEADRPNMSLLFLDDPDHARLRRLVTAAFSARSIAARRPDVERIAAALLDAVDPLEPFDLIATYGAPFPTFVIAAILGIDDAQAEQFRRWSDASTVVLAPERSEDERRAHAEARDGLNDCFARAIAARRKEPRDDLIGALVAAEAQGDSLTDQEILNTCRLLLIAGNVTTTDLIGNGVVALLRKPDQLARLRAEPALWPAAIEELLRYDPPVTAISRQVVTARAIGGCPVEAGQSVTTMLIAANHDPALCPDPHVLDVGRANQKHLSFGAGAHFCLGASLARLEAQVAFQVLFARFPKLRLAPRTELRRKENPAFGGFKAVWLEAA